MSTDDGVSNTAETAEAVPQNGSNGETTAELLNSGEKVDESLAEARADVPENTIAPETSGVSEGVRTEVNKAEDTTSANNEDPKEDTTTDSVKGKDDVEMAVDEKSEKCEIGADGENVDKIGVESTIEVEKNPTKENTDATIETHEVAMAAMETDEVKEDVVEEVKEDIKEDVVEEVTEEVTEKVTGAVKEDSKSEVKEDVVEEVKEDVKGDVVEEVKEDVVEDVVEEAEEDVVEEVKEDIIEEIKEDVVEEVKEDVKEDAVEEFKENAVEEDKEDVVKEVEEDVKEDVKEDVVEEVGENVVKEIKDDVKDEVVAGEEDKDVTMKGEENTESIGKENIVIDISEDSATEVKEGSKKDESTPGKRRRSRGSTETPSSLRSTTRERKVAHQYVPGDFERKQHTDFAALPGKGSKLKDIPKVKSNVERLPMKDVTLSQVHKFLYGGRGNVAKKVVKGQVLAFSGYLLPDDKGTGKEADKFVARAKRMTVPLLKVICDILDVDRSPMGKRAPLGKEVLIDRLIEFIAAPDLKLTVGGKINNKRSRSSSPAKTPKKKRARNSEEVEVEIIDEEMDEDEEEEEEEEGVEVIKGNKMPTKRELRKFVQAYVTCFSMEKTTTKHLIQTASDKFDVNVSSKKKDILDLLAEAMSN